MANFGNGIHCNFQRSHYIWVSSHVDKQGNQIHDALKVDKGRRTGSQLRRMPFFQRPPSSDLHTGSSKDLKLIDLKIASNDFHSYRSLSRGPKSPLDAR